MSSRADQEAFDTMEAAASRLLEERNEARKVAIVYHKLLCKLAPEGDLGISAVLAEFEPIYDWLKTPDP